MPRLTQPFISDARRSRQGAAEHFRPRAKRLPITSLWDEMASAAPVEIDEPLYPRPEGAWDGPSFVDDDELVSLDAAEPFDGPRGLQGRDEDSGFLVPPPSRERPTGATWPPAAPPWRLRLALVAVALFMVAVTWKVVRPDPAVAQAHLMVAAPPVLPPAPAPVRSAPAADPIVAPQPATSVAPVVPPVPASTSTDDPTRGFDYRSARRYLDEQAGFLRTTCMQRAGAPLKRLRIHVKAGPNGRSAIAVPGVGSEVADCVRRALNFPFDRSPNGGAFLYSLGTRSSRLEPRPA